MKISFVIPAFNEEERIAGCLDSILPQVRASKYPWEIIVVNNASTDHTAEIVKKYPDARLVNEPMKGLVRARRAGFLAATGDLIANVDADTRLTPGWLDKVMKAFEADPELVAFSGPFIYYDAPWSVRFSTRLFYYIGFFFYIINRFILRVGSMLQGGNFIVRKSALEKIGGYNTDIDFYGEDTDIARRMVSAGKVKFTFSLPIYSSGRRLAKEGALTIGFRYALNYFWTIFFKKPFSMTSVDIRPEGKDPQFRERTGRERWNAAIALVIFLVVVGIAAFVSWQFLSTTAQNVLKEKWHELSR